jgi:hypothetical protein
MSEKRRWLVWLYEILFSFYGESFWSWVGSPFCFVFTVSDLSDSECPLSSILCFLRSAARPKDFPSPIDFLLARSGSLACLSNLFSSPLQSPPGVWFRFSVDLQVATRTADLRQDLGRVWLAATDFHAAGGAKPQSVAAIFCAST